VSLVYSGTGALKTDFTRTGKRTLAGSVQDGINSVLRYIKNNYMDGFRQDSMDLFLGNYAVKPGQPSPFSDLENNDDALRRKLVPFLPFPFSFLFFFFDFNSNYCFVQIPSLLLLALFMLITSVVVPTGECFCLTFDLRILLNLYFSLVTRNLDSQVLLPALLGCDHLLLPEHHQEELFSVP